MRVYVASWADYEWFQILGIFDNLAAAKGCLVTAYRSEIRDMLLSHEVAYGDDYRTALDGIYGTKADLDAALVAPVRWHRSPVAVKWPKGVQPGKAFRVEEWPVQSLYVDPAGVVTVELRETVRRT